MRSHHNSVFENVVDALNASLLGHVINVFGGLLLINVVGLVMASLLGHIIDVFASFACYF